MGIGNTALHNICKLDNPPVDVVQSLMDCSPETVTWQDSNGWLPLHHACANGGSGQVLRVLVDAYPVGKVAQDKRLRTPLHFAFFRKDAQKSIEMANTNDDLDDVGNSMAEIVTILSDSGAAELSFVRKVNSGGFNSVRFDDSSGLVCSLIFSSHHCVKNALIFFSPISCRFTTPVPTARVKKCSKF